MKISFLLVLWVPLFVSQLGCTNTIFKKFDVVETESVSVDAKQRAIIVTEGEDGVRKIFCAEPSPDALSAFGASLSAGIGYKEIEGHLDQTLAESVKALGDRNATIQLLRDGLYRACEAFANQALDQFQYSQIVAKYENIMVTLLAIEQLTNLNLSITKKNLRAPISPLSSKEPNEQDSNAADTQKLLNESPSDSYTRTPMDPVSIKTIADTVKHLVASVVEKDTSRETCLAFFANPIFPKLAQKLALQGIAESERIESFLGTITEITREATVKLDDVLFRQFNTMKEYCDPVLKVQTSKIHNLDK